MEKQITIDFKGSMVKTTQVIAYIILLPGILGAIITATAFGLFFAALIIIGSCAFLFIMLLCLSTILEQLYLTRKMLEIKAEAEGFEIKAQVWP